MTSPSAARSIRRRVVQLAQQGVTVKGIARRLGRSLNSVYTHLCQQRRVEPANRMLCRHCEEAWATRPRGLCGCCYERAEVRKCGSFTRRSGTLPAEAGGILATG